MSLPGSSAQAEAAVAPVVGPLPVVAGGFAQRQKRKYVKKFPDTDLGKQQKKFHELSQTYLQLSRWTCLMKEKWVPLPVQGLPTVYWKVTDGELQYGLHPQMHVIDQKGFECETVATDSWVSWNFVKDHNKDDAGDVSSDMDKDTLGGEDSEKEPEVKEDNPEVKEHLPEVKQDVVEVEEETQQRD